MSWSMIAGDDLLFEKEDWRVYNTAGRSTRFFNEYRNKIIDKYNIVHSLTQIYCSE